MNFMPLNVNKKSQPINFQPPKCPYMGMWCLYMGIWLLYRGPLGQTIQMASPNVITNYLFLSLLVISFHTLKVLIFASTNFRENLFSREFIFAIEIFENFAGTYFREFREFKIFRIFRCNLFLRVSRFSYFYLVIFRENYLRYFIRLFSQISQWPYFA